MSDEKRLDEIQKRREAIGEAIWVATKMTSHKSRSHGKEYFKVVDKDITLDQIAHYIPTLKIADFIASAKDDITYLLDVIDELQSQLAEAEKALDLFEKAEKALTEANCRADVAIKEMKYHESTYTSTCPRGYTDCVCDPAYIKFNHPNWYKKLYGDKTPEEASYECQELMKKDPNEEYYCYDNEDK